MRVAASIFYVIALAGLLASVVVHVSTFFGYDPTELGSIVWLLHLGILFVFVPAIPIGAMACSKTASSGSLDADAIFQHASKWMIVVVLLCFAYSAVNYFIFDFLVRDGSPHVQDDGAFAIMDRARFVRAITEAEFHKYQSYIARGFSGHWMAFYSLSMTIHSSAARSGRVGASSKSGSISED